MEQSCEELLEAVFDGPPDRQHCQMFSTAVAGNSIDGQQITGCRSEQYGAEFGCCEVTPVVHGLLKPATMTGSEPAEGQDTGGGCDQYGTERAVCLANKSLSTGPGCGSEQCRAENGLVQAEVRVLNPQ